MGDSTNEFVRRSTLIIPVNNKKFVDKSWNRCADAIILDLEDSIPPQEKSKARKEVKEAITIAGKGGSDVLVRVNSGIIECLEDLDASIYNGLSGIAIPKVESAKEINDIENKIQLLEKERELTPGSIKISIAIETAKGFLNMNEIASVSSRTVTITLGTEDFVSDLGIELSKDGLEIHAPKMQVVIAANAFGLQPLGLIGSFSDFRDLEGLHEKAIKAYRFGYKGSNCIHPDQVPILNKVFSPDIKDVNYAFSVIQAFEKATKEGSASTSLNGKMIDIPIVERAYKLVERYKAIQVLERKKEESINKNLNRM